MVNVALTVEDLDFLNSFPSHQKRKMDTIQCVNYVSRIFQTVKTWGAQALVENRK